MEQDQSHELDKLILFKHDNTNLRSLRDPLHILVIDDDPVTCHLIKKLLADKYYFRACGNIQEGLNDYLFLMPDILFLDINLGDKTFNGLDVLKSILKHDPKANVVIISSNGTTENIEEAYNNGASGFILKPFNPSKIIEYTHKCESNKKNQEGILWN